jgi:hypothetical protein
LRTESKAWGPCQAATSLYEELRIEKTARVVKNILGLRITTENLSYAEDASF